MQDKKNMSCNWLWIALKFILNAISIFKKQLGYVYFEEVSCYLFIFFETQSKDSKYIVPYAIFVAFSIYVKFLTLILVHFEFGYLQEWTL